MPICGLCGERINHEEKYDHLMKHKTEDDGTAGCHKCDKRFRGNYELNCHTKVVHEGLTWNCTDCPKVFKSQNGLKYHQKAKHLSGLLHKCSHCDSSFPSNQKLILHKRKDHSVKPLICKHCNVPFVYPWTFKKHESRCQSKPGKDIRIWVCRYCTKKYKTIKYRDQHESKCSEKN